MRSLGESRSVEVQFLLEGLELCPGLLVGQVDHIEKPEAPLYVTEEWRTHAVVQVRTNNQARKVGNWKKSNRW